MKNFAFILQLNKYSLKTNVYRKWRQEKLYKQMTDRCIDEVAEPLRRLELMPEELVTLKIIMLFNYGKYFYKRFIYYFVLKFTIHFKLTPFL